MYICEKTPQLTDFEHTAMQLLPYQPASHDLRNIGVISPCQMALGVGEAFFSWYVRLLCHLRAHGQQQVKKQGQLYEKYKKRPGKEIFVVSLS